MKNLNEMSVKELREEAKVRNIAGRWDMNKTQLVEAIEAFDAEQKRIEEEAKKAAETKAEKKSRKTSAPVKMVFVYRNEKRGEYKVDEVECSSKTKLYKDLKEKGIVCVAIITQEDLVTLFNGEHTNNTIERVSKEFIEKNVATHFEVAA